MTITKTGDINTYVQSHHELSTEGLPLDYTGLDTFEQRSFVLERNHYQVCELTIQYTKQHCYSFQNIALSKEWGYATGQYGLAEGLAMNKDHLWIIVDNNGNAKRRDSHDTRSTLMQFYNPLSL